jgi:two-component system chemotaxis response regulator CheY
MARILICDDSNFCRRTARGILESSGHEVHEAGDGLASLERYVLVKPDLVLLDLSLTGLDNLEVLERLRQIDAAARVIVTGSDLQSPARALVEAAGARSFIQKPFAVAEVLRVVKGELEGVRR